MNQYQQESQRGQGVVDRLNSAYNTQRSIRKIVGRARWISKAPILTNPYVLGAFVAVIIVIVFIIVISGTGSGEPPGPGDEKDKIPGLSLALDGPLETDNNTEVRYTLRVSFDQAKSPIPLSSITVFDNLPSDTEFVSATGEYVYNPGLKLISWALKAIGNQNGFSLIIKPSRTDFRFSNKMYATTNFTPQGGGGGSCTEGSSFCSIENLSKYFPPDQARNASIICNRESGSNLLAKNAGCLTGKSADYSIGLFQINMLVHCPGAFSSYTINPPSCTIDDESELAACETKFRDPEENIKKAVELSQNGTNWGPWSAAKVCGIIK